jgi:glycosyltransferase involved in cell wall biosynthesis
VVVANSRHTAARFAMPSFRAGVRVVSYGIDVARFDPGRIDRGEARERLGVGEEDVVLAVVGQLTPWKGQDHAIKLLARLQGPHPETRLVLAGAAKFVSRATRFDNPTYVRGLRELAHSLGVGERVTFAGEVDDVPALLRAVDVALVPSWEEPFGRAVTEALAMEVPVVATSVGGPSEVIADGEDGFLAPPTDLDRWEERVSALVADTRLRAGMGRRGRTRVAEGFPMEGYAAAVVEAYGAATSRMGPSTA